MILTTAPNVEGKRILEYKGVVRGEAIVGANFIRDLMASMRDFFGAPRGLMRPSSKRPARSLSPSSPRKRVGSAPTPSSASTLTTRS